MANAGIGLDLNVQLIGRSGRTTAPPPVCPTVAPPTPPPLPAATMATVGVVRTTPTTLRELEMTPMCTELDGMDVDEDADAFSDGECCSVDAFDPLFRGGFVIDPSTGARVRLSPAHLLAPGLTMCSPSRAENKWVRGAICNQFKLFNHYQMLERCPALKPFLDEAKLLEGPDPKDTTGRTMKTGFTSLPECNGNVSDIKVDAPECVVRLQKLQRAMAKAGIGADLNVQLIGGSGLVLSRTTAPPPVCPTAAPPAPVPPSLPPAQETGAAPMATDDVVCTAPTTLRELEMAPTCSELDGMDVDEDADGFSDTECCGVDAFDPLFRGEE